MNLEGKLEGKVAIVTGGAGVYGIGRGIVECMTAEGATVVSFDIAAGEEHANSYKVDVTDEAAVGRAVADVFSTWGQVDILVNNAGTAGEIGDPFPLNNVKNWEHVYRTNMISMMLMTKALWNNFTIRRSGRIINIASIVGHGHGDLKMKPAYNASKAAIIEFTKDMAIQLAPYEVTVNAISPGLLYTGFWRKLGKQLQELRPEQYPHGTETYDVFLRRVGELVPLRREQTPEDIGKAAVFLASDDARNITGIDVPVDGGVLAR